MCTHEGILKKKVANSQCRRIQNKYQFIMRGLNESADKSKEIRIKMTTICGASGMPCSVCVTIIWLDETELIIPDEELTKIEAFLSLKFRGLR